MKKLTQTEKRRSHKRSCKVIRNRQRENRRREEKSNKPAVDRSISTGELHRMMAAVFGNTSTPKRTKLRKARKITGYDSRQQAK